jgi:hypothetical protein
MFSFLNANSANTMNCAYPSIKETIPPSSLGYHTNNRFPNFPPIMSDGRAVISNWQPEAVVNERIIKDNNIKSNWQYRQFIRQHAKEIMEHNFNETCNDTGYLVQRDNHESKTPYVYKSIEDTTKVLGVENSDLKELYLSRERLDARKVAPAMTQAELIQTYGIPKNVLGGQMK